MGAISRQEVLPGVAPEADCGSFLFALASIGRWLLVWRVLAEEPRPDNLLSDKEDRSAKGSGQCRETIVLEDQAIALRYSDLGIGKD